MLKEIGDKMTVLINLLPRIVDPADARHLMNVTFSGSINEKKKIRISFRDYYYVAQNVPNGHYSLLMGEKVDRLCLDSLIVISDYCSSKRSSLGLGDTSQHGNWQGFRNTVFEGKPIILDKEWMSKIPSQGKLEFDFVVMADITTLGKSTPINNKRFFSLIKELGIVDDNHYDIIERKITALSNESKDIMDDSSKPRQAMSFNTYSAMMKHLQILYDNNNNRGIDIDMKDISKEEAWLLDPTLPRPTPLHETDTDTSAIANDEKTEMIKERKKSNTNTNALPTKKSSGITIIIIVNIIFLSSSLLFIKVISSVKHRL